MAHSLMDQYLVNGRCNEILEEAARQRLIRQAKAARGQQKEHRYIARLWTYGTYRRRAPHSREAAT